MKNHLAKIVRNVWMKFETFQNGMETKTQNICSVCWNLMLRLKYFFYQQCHLVIIRFKTVEVWTLIPLIISLHLRDWTIMKNEHIFTLKQCVCVCDYNIIIWRRLNANCSNFVNITKKNFVNSSKNIIWVITPNYKIIHYPRYAKVQSVPTNSDIQIHLQHIYLQYTPIIPMDLRYTQYSTATILEGNETENSRMEGNETDEWRKHKWILHCEVRSGWN